MFCLALLIHILMAGWLFSEHVVSDTANRYLNESVFSICIVFVSYFIAKGVIVHKSLFCNNHLLDFVVERLVIPIAMAPLLIRYLGTGINATEDFRFLIVVLLFADPANAVHSFFRELETIQSGKFLGPLIPDHPKSAADYISPVLLFLVLYFVVLR